MIALLVVLATVKKLDLTFSIATELERLFISYMHIC